MEGGRFEAFCRIVLPPRHPAGGLPQAGAGGVEVAVTEVRAHTNPPALVAVVVAVVPGDAGGSALLQAAHLPDEVHGQVRALTVPRKTPRSKGGGESCQAGEECCPLHDQYSTTEANPPSQCLYNTDLGQ